MLKKKKIDKPEPVYCMKGYKVGIGPVNPELHLPVVYEGINDLQVNQYLMATFPATLQQERNFLEGVGKDDKNKNFAIYILKTGEFIGLMGIEGIDYRSGVAGTGSVIFDPKHWKNGYGFDAKMLVLYYSFYCLNLRRISSSVIAFNERSAGCLTNCGYKEEGRREKMYYRHGNYHDQILFRIFKDEFVPVWEKYSKNLPENGWEV